MVSFKKSCKLWFQIGSLICCLLPNANAYGRNQNKQPKRIQWRNWKLYSFRSRGFTVSVFKDESQKTRVIGGDFEKIPWWMTFFKTLSLPRSFLKVVPIQKGPQSLIHNNIYITHFAAAFSPHLATSLGFMRLQDMDLWLNRLNIYTYSLKLTARKYVIFWKSGTWKGVNRFWFWQ